MSPDRAPDAPAAPAGPPPGSSLFEDAKALLVGSGGTFDPRAGLAKLLEADAAGEADAPLVLANLAAAGAWRPQSWSEALELLARAAGRGSAAARGQLQVLAGADDAGGDWTALARRVDIEAWLTPPGVRRRLCETPRIRAVEGFASPGVCDWLRRRATGRLVPAKMLAAYGATPQYSTARTNSDFILDIVTTDLVVAFLRERISRLVSIPTAGFLPPQILHYAEGQELKPHFDFLSRSVTPEEAERLGDQVITVLLFLNEDYDGGETDFPRAGVRFKGRAGEALMFANVDLEGRPDPMSLHAGLPPRGGEKWLFSQWIRNRPVAAVG